MSGPVPSKRCGLCGRAAADSDLVWLRGLKGPVCRPRYGCDRQYPALGGLREWLAGPGATVVGADLDDILVDNPKH